MVKKTVAVSLFILLMMVIGGGTAEGTRVYDQASLFTQSEITQLESEIATFSAETGIDFVVWTSRTARDESDMLPDAHDFYDQGGFGLDNENSGVLLFIDMYNRIPSLSTCGAMIDYLTDERCDRILDVILDDLRVGAYASAASTALRYTHNYYNAGIPEGQYRYDMLTGEMLTSRHRALTMSEIVLSVVIGLIAALIMGFCVRAVYTLRGGTYKYDFRAHSSTKLRVSQDQLLRTTVRRIPIASNNGGGGGGGGLRSGGSGVRVSSGGISHGGRSGGRF